MKLALVPILLIAMPVAAEPVASSEEKPPTPAEPTTLTPHPHERALTAVDVQNAPTPGNESGRTDDGESGDSTLRSIARGALFVPKLALEVGMAPVRGLMWADDRYDLQGLYYRTFFNADQTIGLFPTAAYTTGFGISAGGRFEDRNVFGEHESVALQATTGLITGEPYREGFLASVRSGNRIARWLQLGADANFDRRPADPFDGIGNGDIAKVAVLPVDPLTSATAIETYHRYQEARVAITGDAHLGKLHLLGTGALTQLRYAQSTTGSPIDEVYAPMDLVGFSRGVENAYGELEVRYDSRHRKSVWEPTDDHAAGTLVAASLGRVDRLDAGVDFWHYGVELQQFVRIAKGPRVLIVRFHGEGVTGSVTDVPFTELPMLGGGTFLRGYTFERYRDRVAAVGSLQYQWDISHYADAYLFSDAGRVFSALDEISARDLRVGFGLGVKLRGQSGFLLEATLASSIDGGLFASVSFNPVLDTGVRWR